MTPLRQWWLALAELPGQLAVEAEWQRRLGGNLAPLKPFLGPTKQRAQSLPRDDGRDGSMLRVVPGSAGIPPVVIDDLTGTRREATDSELILRQAKPAAIAKALHEGLQLDGVVGMTPQNGFCWDLGQAAVSDNGKDLHGYIMRWVPGKGLGAFLHEELDKLTPEHLLSIARQLARLMAILHERGVSHNDPSLANWLVAFDSNNAVQVFCIDFDNFYDVIWPPPYPPLCLGTEGIMAPEIELARETGQTAYGLECDVFALGVLIHYCLLFCHPQEGLDPEERRLQTIKGEWHYKKTQAAGLGLNPRVIPGSLRHKLTAAFHKDPTTRPTAHEVFELLEVMNDHLAFCDACGGHSYVDGAAKTCPHCRALYKTFKVEAPALVGFSAACFSASHASSAACR